MIMDVNHELTRVLKGRIVQSMQVEASEVSIGFFDGSTMQIKSWNPTVHHFGSKRTFGQSWKMERKC
jgi:hypothetical protein